MIFTTGRYLPVGFMRAVEEYLCGLMCSLEFSAEGVECLQCISIQQSATERFSRFKQHLPFTRPTSKPKLYTGSGYSVYTSKMQEPRKESIKLK